MRQIASPLLRSLFVRAVTNKISWHLPPRRSRASCVPALTDVRVNANVERQPSTHEMLSLHTLRR